MSASTDLKKLRSILVGYAREGQKRKAAEIWCRQRDMECVLATVER